jgi:hypothetical protein
MPLPLVLWSVWGVVVVLFVILKIYMMGLSRDEDDQLVLQEGVSQHTAEQAAIMARFHKVEPLRRLLFWALIAMSLVIIGYYVVDMIRQFQ